MTRLRKMMLEELERRNYSEATTRCYIRTVEDFSRRFKCSPDCLGPEHIREYQAELFKKRKLSPGTVTQRLAALRFFYIKTLKKTWSIADTPYPKRAFHVPAVLSREEVARLIFVRIRNFGFLANRKRASNLLSPARLSCNSADRTRQVGRQQRGRPLALPQVWWADDGRRKTHRR